VSPEFSITAHHLSGVHVVALHGELDIASVDGLAEALVELAGSTLVVDLSKLTFMDSTGIGLLWLPGIAFWPTDRVCWCSRDRRRSSVKH
jgi:hypothetical protein